jgi:hypothetical protein
VVDDDGLRRGEDASRSTYLPTHGREDAYWPTAHSIHEESSSVRYFAAVGIRGPVRTGATPWALDVLAAPGSPTPIGVASCCGCGENDLARWAIRVAKRPVPGLWHLIDGEFIPAK